MAGVLEKEFSSTEDEVLAHVFAIDPRTAVLLGLHQYDGRLPDLSNSAVSAWTARARQLLDSVKGLDVSNLEPRRRLDGELLAIMLERELFELEELRVHEKHPNLYVGQLNVNPYIIRNYAPLDERIRAVVSHLRTVPRFLEAVRSTLVKTLPEPHLRVAIQAGEGVAKNLRVDAVKASREASPEVHREFEEASAVALREVEAFLSLLANEYRSRATGEFAMGRELYQKMLWVGGRVSTPVERLLEMGLEDLERNKKALIETADGLWPQRSVQDAVKELGSEHPSADHLISETHAMLEDIRRFVVERGLVTVPSEDRCVVTESPPFARVTMTAAMSSPGAFDTLSKEAFYYVTPVDESWPNEKKEEWLRHLNYPVLKDISIHEAYPGHYTHFLNRRLLKTKTAKAFTSYAFSEGWAHYAEQMMLEEGFGGGDLRLKMAQLQEALLRNCRYVVSIKMHTQGMSLEEATRFIMENAFYDRLPAEREALRGAVDPGYLNYTLGKLTILKVREEYFGRYPNATLREFHDKLLSLGSPPIGLLRDLMLA